MKIFILAEAVADFGNRKLRYHCDVFRSRKEADARLREVFFPLTDNATAEDVISTDYCPGKRATIVEPGYVTDWTIFEKEVL